MDKLHFERLLSTKVRRRSFLLAVGTSTGLAVASQGSHKVVAQPRFSDYPFSLGVASGDPLPNSVVLWTRLAPDPLNGGGMPQQNVLVQWQIATDDSMKHIVKRGRVLATPELGHSVHVDVRGLKSGQWYWYQFKVGNELSSIGRTRTAPALGSQLEQFRFAFASCQDYEQGYYTAYQHMAEEDLDLVVHLGDYIYEGAQRPGRVRQHNGPEASTVEGYRNRYALYKSDPNLQAAHAAFPWVVTPDNHETVEDELGDFIRRAAAYQAYYEHMPLRRTSMPVGPNMQLYRRLTYGNLIEFSVLDARQFKNNQQICGAKSGLGGPAGNTAIVPQCPEALEPERTLLGSKQEQWLFNGFDQSRAHWNVIAQQVPMAQFNYDPGSGNLFYHYGWDGYPSARTRILNHILQSQLSNPVVISGDWHSSWVSDLKSDFDNPYSLTLATEFIGTSISSGYPANLEVTQKALADNPHIKFFDGTFRGYVRCEVNREHWLTDFRVVSTVATPDAPISTLVQFVVENGRPGAERV
ncbi:alkaline phosphatase [Nostocales cyanobacterium HT-58-2]|nr:alkaline phosphatase [Nostocales cyanobacterium HT-58-2]